MAIAYLKHDQIDFNRWDQCIHLAYNGIVYAYSWYLNTVSPDWEALVEDDYAAVMPLPARRKIGIWYLAQPPFCQQLGVFSTRKSDSRKIEAFLSAIPSHFRYTDINLNTFNRLDTATGICTLNRLTYQLDLIHDYDELFLRYPNNTRRNLRAAYRSGVSISEGLSVNQIHDFAKKYLPDKDNKANQSYFLLLRNLVSNGILNKSCQCLGAYNAHNQLIALACFFKSHQKSIFLLSVSSPEGKTHRGMFLLIDHYIRENSQHPLTLDFEGSMIPGIARFYAGFGAQPVSYSRVVINRLPGLLRPLKRIPSH